MFSFYPNLCFSNPGKAGIKNITKGRGSSWKLKKDLKR